MASTDFRFDPFRQVFRPVFQSNEVHVAQYFDALGRVGFFTREAVQRRSPSSVVLKDAGNNTLTEVSRTTVPVYATYRVDYSALTFWSHCFVEVHETRIGGVFTISYHGLGTGLNSSNRSDDRFNLERSVSVAGNVTTESLRVLAASVLRGNVSLAVNTGATLSMSGKRVQDVIESLTTDLITLATFLGLTNRTQPEILTGSGNWPKPANVTKVFFVLVGPGGSGDAAGGGGGGGASVYGVADLDAIGGDMFAYVVGVVGIATTMFGCSAGAGGSGSGGSSGSGGTGSVGVDVVGKHHPGGNGGHAYYVAVSQDGTNRIMSSPNGIDWTSRSAPQNNQWNGVAYGNGVFVGVSSDGTDRVMRSTNGITWTSQSASSPEDWFAVTYGNGLFVAVAQGVGSVVMTSPDGITWTGHGVPEANSWVAITYGAGLFVAVSQNGTNRVMTSPDGITWTARTSPTGVWNAIVWSGSKFVVVGSSGTSYVMTSPDGITWTAQTPAQNNSWFGVTYGGGIFVAVSIDGTDRVMTSPDGITWTSRSASAANSWLNVTYGNGLFVAVAQDGTDRVMTSPDGITWTGRTASENNTWRFVIPAAAGGGGSSAGGFGGNGANAELSDGGVTDKFFAGNGGANGQNGASYGGGAGAGGTGADGLILLIY